MIVKTTVPLPEGFDPTPMQLEDIRALIEAEIVESLRKAMKPWHDAFEDMIFMGVDGMSAESRRVLTGLPESRWCGSCMSGIHPRCDMTPGRRGFYCDCPTCHPREQ